MFKRIVLAAGLLAFLGPLRAQEPIPVELDSAWRHPHIDLTLPPSLSAFVRAGIVRLDEEQYNLAATLEDAATGTTATLYVYRTGIADVPIWADRTATTILSSSPLGKIDLERAQFAAFTPPDGSGDDSGFLLVSPLSGGSLRSTGLVIFLHDEWLIKLRMSSEQLDRDALQTRMTELIGSLPLGKAKLPVPAFATIEDCPAKLTIKKDAKLVRLDMTGTLILGAVLATALKKRGGQANKDVQWCRESLTEGYAVYRPGAARDAYAIAFQDAGTTASVGEFDMGSLMNPSRGYIVSVSNGVNEEILPPFDRLPKPEQVAAVVGRIGPVTTIDVRPCSEGEQTIYVGEE